MPIPKEILAVERPKNTIVASYGKNGDRYAVRQRTGCVRKGGRNLPITGPTIGHIIGGKYVPIDAEAIADISEDTVEIRDWANIAEAESCFSDILGELRRVYSESDSLKIYSMAVLRTTNAGIKDCELGDAYRESFLSVSHPDVALSRNTISGFLNALGKNYSKIVAFMRNRAAGIGLDHHLLIDGTLKSNESKVNSLSEFSRKALKKGTRDISVIYAFDLDAMEPVCSKCYPGNVLDSVSFEDFLKECRIERGIIVGDKAFTHQSAREWIDAHKEIHFLSPVKRNSKYISTHDMLAFDGVLRNQEGITYRKAKVSGDAKWLYAFRDASLAAKEEKDYLARAKKDGSYSVKDHEAKRKTFGVVVLESSLDADAETVYAAYAERWQIEVVMRYYKHALDFDETREHDDYSILGSEFVDFLSSLLTFRLLKAFDKARLLERMNYGRAMKILARAKKAYVDGEWKLRRIALKEREVLEDLGLIEKPMEEPKRKRGRPRKNQV